MSLRLRLYSEKVADIFYNGTCKSNLNKWIVVTFPLIRTFLKAVFALKNITQH